MSAPVLTWLFLAQGQFIEHSLFTNHCHAQIHFLPEVSSSFCSAQTSVQGPLHPTLRANLFPKVTDLFCRLPLPTLFYKPEAVNLGDLMRLWVRIGVQIKKRMWLFKDSWRHTRHPEIQIAWSKGLVWVEHFVFRGVWCAFNCPWKATCASLFAHLFVPITASGLQG